MILWRDEYCGLEIQRRLRFEGKNVRPGQLYPALRRLEEQGYISSREETRVGANRIYHTITEQGKHAVVDNLMEYLYIFRHISLDYLHPYLEENVEKTNLQPGETVLDVSSLLMEKLRRKTIEKTSPDGRYMLVNTNPEFSDLVTDWIKSEELDSVELLDKKQVEAFPEGTVDVVLLLFNVFELNMEWSFSTSIRVLRTGGRLVVCDILAREEDTIRDDLYKVYMPNHSKSGLPNNLDEIITEKGMKPKIFEITRGMVMGIFEKLG